MSLRQRIVSDMTAAMKAKDAARTSTLRMVKAAVHGPATTWAELRAAVERKRAGR